VAVRQGARDLPSALGPKGERELGNTIIRAGAPKASQRRDGSPRGQASSVPRERASRAGTPAHAPEASQTRAVRLRGLDATGRPPETREPPGPRAQRRARERRLATQTATGRRHRPRMAHGAGRGLTPPPRRAPADPSGHLTSSVGAHLSPKDRAEHLARARPERHATPRAPMSQAGRPARAAREDRATPRAPNGNQGPQAPADPAGPPVPTGNAGRPPATKGNPAPDAPKGRAGPIGRLGPILPAVAEPRPAGRPGPDPRAAAEPRAQAMTDAGPAGRPGPDPRAAAEARAQAMVHAGAPDPRLRPAGAGHRRPGPARPAAPGR
jgi:hypothetical protein